MAELKVPASQFAAKPEQTPGEVGSRMAAEQAQAEQAAATRQLQDSAKNVMEQQAAPLQKAAINAAAVGAVQESGKIAKDATLRGAEASLNLRQNQFQADKLQRVKELSLMRKQISETALQQEKELAALDLATKARVFDDNFKFQQDEFGRTLFNTRQMVDFAVTQAKSEIELNQYEDIINQSLERKRFMLEQASRVIEQHMQQAYQAADAMDMERFQQDLFTMNAAAEEAKRKARADANNIATAWSAGGAIVGTVIGAVAGAWATGGTGTLAGATAGATIGSGIGGAVGGFVGQQKAQETTK